jgi:hypothetical protein
MFLTYCAVFHGINNVWRPPRDFQRICKDLYAARLSSFATRSQSHIPKNTLKSSWKRSLTSTAINKRISMISLRWKRCGGEQARETLLPEWSDQWTCRCPRFRGRSIIAYLSAYPCPLCVFAYTLTFNHCTINRTSDLAFRIWFLHPWLCNLCGAEKQ